MGRRNTKIDKKNLPHKLITSILPKKMSQEKTLKLFEKYRNLVYYIAHKFPFKNQTLFQELCCAGMVGLLHAIKHYTKKKENTFPIYAYKWILQFMKRELRNLSPIKLPQILLHYYSDIREIEKNFFYEKKRFPQAEEIVEELMVKNPTLKIEKRKKQRLINILKEMQIGFVNLNEEKLSNFSNTTQFYNSYKTYSELYQDYIENVIRKGLNSLDERKAKLIKLYFGIESNTQWNLASIGRYLKISRERARQLLNSALKQLREIITKEEFELKIRNQ